MNVAIIPARGGSKRIPRKNIKDFCGKPIIAYSIVSALASECFERVIVSTDDHEIAKIALALGAEVPFERPQWCSDDMSSTLDVIQHAITAMGLQDQDNICCIYATAPFLQSKTIVEGLSLLNTNNYDYVFTATEYRFPIQRAFYLNNAELVTMFEPQHLTSRSQDLQVAYHDAGQFYWGSGSSFKQGNSFFGARSKGIMLPYERVQDIDNIADWEYAEKMFQLLAED